MQHLDDGALRRSLDDPWSVPAPQQDHLRSCDACRGKREAIAADARFAADRLASGAAARVDVDAAFDRFAGAAGGGALSSSASARSRGGSVWNDRRVVAPVASVLAAAVVVLVLAFTPAGTVAQNFLTIFEPQHFVAVPVTKAEMEYLPDLQSFGTIVQRVQPEQRTVATAAQASALTGLPVRVPSWVPASVPGPVRIIAISRGVASFTFSAEKARRFALASHRPMPPMPARLDGSTLTLDAGPMVLIGYGPLPAEMKARAAREHPEDGETMHDIPPLVVVQSAAPLVTSTGATAREIEAYLLAMPGVAPELAAEIRAIGDPNTTMPIPVPVDKAFAQNVSVDGVTGLAVGDETGVGGMIVWQKNGIVYGVGGALPQAQLMEVAASLR